MKLFMSCSGISILCLFFTVAPLTAQKVLIDLEKENSASLRMKQQEWKTFSFSSPSDLSAPFNRTYNTTNVFIHKLPAPRSLQLALDEQNLPGFSFLHIFHLSIIVSSYIRKQRYFYHPQFLLKNKRHYQFRYPQLPALLSRLKAGLTVDPFLFRRYHSLQKVELIK